MTTTAPLVRVEPTSWDVLTDTYLGHITRTGSVYRVAHQHPSCRPLDVTAYASAAEAVAAILRSARS